MSRGKAAGWQSLREILERTHAEDELPSSRYRELGRARRTRNRKRRRPRRTAAMERAALSTVQPHPRAEAATFLDTLTVIEAEAELALRPPPRSGDATSFLQWAHDQAVRLRSIRDRAGFLARLLEDEQGQREPLRRMILQEGGAK